MKAHRAVFPVRAMCRVLGLSPSGFYAWLKRPRSASALRDDALRVLVRRSWEASRRTYGRPRIHADLAAWGERVGPKRVARLMREEGIEGASRRRRKVALTVRDAHARPAPDLVERDFSAEGPDQLWVADITYVPAGAGWLYLAVVVDAWSRRVVGWAMETHLRGELVERALAMAVENRSPETVIHHSDRRSATNPPPASSASVRSRKVHRPPRHETVRRPCASVLPKVMFHIAPSEPKILARPPYRGSGIWRKKHSTSESLGSLDRRSGSRRTRRTQATWMSRSAIAWRARRVRRMSDEVSGVCFFSIRPGS